MSQEVQKNLVTIKKQISNKSSIITNKLFVEIWKGTHDIKDNISGVSLWNEKRLSIASINLVQLECEENYLELAKIIGEKLAEDLQIVGYEVIVENKL